MRFKTVVVLVSLQTSSAFRIDCSMTIPSFYCSYKHLGQQLYVFVGGGGGGGAIII